MLMCLQMINVHPITTGGATGGSSANVLHLQGILSSSSSKKATVRPVNKDESGITVSVLWWLHQYGRVRSTDYVRKISEVAVLQ